MYLFLLLPALALLIIYGARRKRAELGRFASEMIFPHIILGRSTFKRNVKIGLFMTATLFLVLCLLGPRWGFHWEEVRRQGVDIIIALDTSDSMLSQDVKPSRLERSKREVYDLIKMLRGDRMGLVVFAGDAFVQCPLTLDHGACLMFLDYIDTTVVPQKGTNLEAAIRKAVGAFDDLERGSKAIILISDGGSLQGDPMAAADEAKQKGIKIYTIGIGREDEEVPIPLSGGGLKYKGGKMVTTKLEDEVLRDVALATGGIYVRSVTGDLDLEKIYYEEIHKKMEKRELESTRRKRWEERFQWPLLGAVALLFAEAIMGERQSNAAA
jgi:Ca-activated chloride channel family protein